MEISVRKFTDYLNSINKAAKVYMNIELNELDSATDRKLTANDLLLIILSGDSRLIDYNIDVEKFKAAWLHYCKTEDIIKFLNSELLTFLDFDMISTYLENSDLSNAEKLEIINICILKNVLVLKDKKENKDKDYDDKELERLLSIYDQIKKSYLDKKDSYTRVDIDRYVNSIGILGFSDIIQKDIKLYLKKEISKRDNNTKINIKLETEKDRKLKEIENKKLENELVYYLDLKTMLPIRFLSMDEILHVVSILKKLQYPEDTIRRFIKISELQLNQTNPITTYVQLFNKLKFYEEKFAISNEISELEQYFKEIFLSDSEDYIFYKNCISEILNKVLRPIQNNYDYELKRC